MLNDTDFGSLKKPFGVTAASVHRYRVMGSLCFIHAESCMYHHLDQGRDQSTQQLVLKGSFPQASAHHGPIGSMV